MIIHLFLLTASLSVQYKLDMFLYEVHPTTHSFFIRIPNFALNFNSLNFLGFEPYIILKLFLNVESVNTSENQRTIINLY